MLPKRAVLVIGVEFYWVRTDFLKLWRLILKWSWCKISGLRSLVWCFGRGIRCFFYFLELSDVTDLRRLRILCGIFLGNEIIGECDPIRYTLLRK